MRVSKDGKVKLERGEVRIGNFFIKDEGEDKHIRVVDLNSCFTVRVDKKMPLGIWLDNMLQKGEPGYESIKVWVSVMWSLLSVAPDQEFVEEVLDVAKSSMLRHPVWYGIKADATPDDDEEAAKEVEGVLEFESDLKGALEKENESEVADGDA